MTTHPVFTLILPLCTMLMALGFVCCWRWCQGQRDLLWMAACFALFGTGVSMQLLVVPAALDVNAVLSAALYHAAVWCQAEAMNQRFQVRMQRLAAAGVGLMSLGWLAYYALVDDQLYVRILVLNFGLAAQLAVATPWLWRVPVQRPLERWLRALFAVFIVSFGVRTVLTMPDAQGLTAENFGLTLAWASVQICLLLFAMLFAFLYLGLAVQHAMQQLLRERDSDPLTQLLNRRAFWEAVARLPAHAPVGTVLVCDVDHFKQVNDRWGHTVGDAVLQRVACLLQASVRGSDWVVRYGGEEFVVLLHGMPLQVAAAAAQRIAVQLADLVHPELPPDMRITASFGLAAVALPAQLPAALQHADAQLYAAKAAGRNCVRWASASAQAPASAPASAPATV